MLGHALMHELTAAGHEVHGTLRSTEGLPQAFVSRFGHQLVIGVDASDAHLVSQTIVRLGPDVVINAVGVIKQVPSVDDKVLTADLNGVLPHRLASACLHADARLVQISTDCVFSGRHGGSTEDDVPDPVDFYGRSKLLGEVDAPHVTLRTSIIGPEIRQRASLLEWFLGQHGQTVRGFTRAVFSGLPTVELARVIADVVLPRPALSGLWHIAGEPITKADLLRLIAEQYGWQGTIEDDEQPRIDRSMSAERFAEATGYRAPPWPDLVASMYAAHQRWTDG
jgi:dTDP-4-dehydrorhamnose reductase